MFPFCLFFSFSNFTASAVFLRAYYKTGPFLLFWSAGATLLFPYKAPNWECQMESTASETQAASWPNKWISKTLSRLCEATIQVDAKNNTCASRMRINQDAAVCSNIRGVVVSHTVKWSSLKQFLQWMSHHLSWLVYSELFLFSKNGGEIFFSLSVSPQICQTCADAIHSTAPLQVQSQWDCSFPCWKQGSWM